jgi:hypothetical protein
MNKEKKIKILMITSGIITAVCLITFMILNHYVLHLDFLYSLLCSFSIILIWIFINYLVITLMIKK